MNAHPFGFCYRFINRAYKQERTFRQVVMLAFNDFPESHEWFLAIGTYLPSMPVNCSRYH